MQKKIMTSPDFTAAQACQDCVAHVQDVTCNNTNALIAFKAGGMHMQE